jgi:hypothetical protein
MGRTKGSSQAKGTYWHRLHLSEIASYGADSLNRLIGHNIAAATPARQAK